ncbi:hypothetical protein F4553_003277 [Allocatelliglobosispora scoriae]|uniref:PH domain-containing protein n=1 Tax=Allocatelliglobosispora scoriae TaxID=643052 RepID=A0A841BR79_9ACTN|nr:hypothetical protein [Allocatelliglobosispora scoriae]MBB5869898.1 hypothetical protein [Allocatelliglobosispora scoriae]
MKIPAGRSAARAWRALPADVREQAIALGRAGQPHPDPAIRRIIVDHLAHGAAPKRALGSTMGLVFSLSSLSIIAPFRYSALRLVVIAVMLIAVVAIIVVVTRWGRLRYLGPNVRAVALATPAPAGPLILVRSTDSLVQGAVFLILPLVAFWPPVLVMGREAAHDDDAATWVVHAVFTALVAAVVVTMIAGVVGYFALALGPAGARRQLGVIDADGIRIHHLRLTVPWRDVRKINGNDEDGVTGLGIWLADPARTLATAELSPLRRRIFLRSAPETGWLRLPAAPVTGPEGTSTVVLAIAMHRDHLNQHVEVAV